MYTSESIYMLIFTSGLLGGFGHCLGMCGPVVASYSVAVRSSSMAPHILYNLGRISTYSLMGGIAGMTGSFVGLTENIHGLHRGAMILAGIVVVLMGLGLAGWLPSIKVLKRGESPFSGFISSLIKNNLTGMTAGAFYPMGLLMGFIPCGLVYTALIATARAGMEADFHFIGFLEGTAMMLLFGLGTAPSLLLFGKIVNTIGLKLRLRLYRLSAVVMIIMGLLFISRAL